MSDKIAAAAAVNTDDSISVEANLPKHFRAVSSVLAPFIKQG